MADVPAGIYPPAVAKMVLEEIRKLQARGVIPDAARPASYNPPPNTPIYVRNVSEETIPRFACMQAVGTFHVTSDGEGINYITVNKPQDTTGEAGPYLFNLFEPIPPLDANGYPGHGIATAGPHVRVLGGGSCVAGELYGPVVNSWQVATPGKLLNAIGSDVIAPNVGRMIIQRAENTKLITLDDCLFRSDETGMGTPLQDADGDPVEAPEPIEFLNKLKLDGMADAFAEVHQYQIDGETVWVLMHVSEKKARWVKAAKDGDNWSIVVAREGEDPTPCGFDLICDFDCSCLKDGAEIEAFYDTNSDTYFGISTESALLGAPDTLYSLGGDSPGNRPYFECSDGTYDLVMQNQGFKAFKCDLPSEEIRASINADIFECLDLCNYWCLYCTADCTPCTGSCTWTWQSGAVQDWVLTETCTGGEPDECGCYEKPSPDLYPDPQHNDEVVLPCSFLPEPNACCFDCKFFDNGFGFGGGINNRSVVSTGPSYKVTDCEWAMPGRGTGGIDQDDNLLISVTYLGYGKWKVDTFYEVFLQFDITNGTCQGGPVSSTMPIGGAGNLVATANTEGCEPCPHCAYCDTYSIQITSLHNDFTPSTIYFEFDQNGDSVNTGECEWEVPVHVKEYDGVGVLDNEYDDTAVVTYDGATWYVSIADTPTYAYDQTFEADDDCAPGIKAASRCGIPSCNGVLTIGRTACP